MRSAEHDSTLTFRLPWEHAEALKRLAVAQESSVSDLLRSAVEILVETEREERRREARQSNGFLRKLDALR